MLSALDFQRQTLRLYGELLCQSESWRGLFVLACGPQSSATGLPAAVSIAGGTSLVVDPDLAGVKAVFRQGGVDFVVSTLDEALRVLKNEIRKQKSLSVVLVSSVVSAIEELADRGVLPDLYVQIGSNGNFSPMAKNTLCLAENERLILNSDSALHWLTLRGFSESMFPVTAMSELRDLDERLVQTICRPDNGRLQWLRRISHYQFPSSNAGRVVWLTQEELETISVAQSQF